MVGAVRRNPRRVWSVRAVPTEAAGASSLTAAENCAESAITAIPHTSNTGTRIQSGRPYTSPTPSAHTPDTTIATLVTVVRPSRSAYRPPSQHPIAPIPTTQNVTRAATPIALPPGPRRAVSLAATKLAVHVH